METKVEQFRIKKVSSDIANRCGFETEIYSLVNYFGIINEQNKNEVLEFILLKLKIKILEIKNAAIGHEEKASKKIITFWEIKNGQINHYCKKTKLGLNIQSSVSYAEDNYDFEEYFVDVDLYFKL